jgi:transketolase
VDQSTSQRRCNVEPLDARSLHLRRLVLDGLEGGERGHIGSSMSLIEMVRVLYDHILRHRPEDPSWPDRDRFILSKGHGCLALYAILADKGYFPADELRRFCRIDGILGGHPDASKVPGVEASTGSLGHGLSIGVGMALAMRIRGNGARVYVAMGDGELNEGSVWEAAMSAGTHKLGNLIGLVDRNMIQSFGFTEQITQLEPLLDKWQSFGFDAQTVDGHDVPALRRAIEKCHGDGSRPHVLICETVKGKGIPFAENDPAWHHKSNLSAEILNEMRQALES